MANEEQLEILEQGVDIWNKWRLKNSAVKIDLTYADLSGLDLREVDLSKADLSHADLNGASLVQANLSEADIREANLLYADLSYADLKGANLSDSTLRADFSYADLGRTDLRGANLSQADLSGANLSDSILNGANLYQAVLAQIDLTSVSLSKVNLSGAYLNGVNLRGADLNDVNFSDANLKEADLRGAQLRRARLGGSFLTDAKLAEAELNEADLRGADLSGADLRNADLSDAYLREANLREADVDGANLSRATVGDTIFANVSNFNKAIGLEFIEHSSLSSIDIHTIRLSKGKIPEVFLRGCGLSDIDIEYAKLANLDISNEEIIRIQYRIYDLRATQAIQISPLFISYSHTDNAFVDRLEENLNEKGVRFWRDIHDMKSGRMEKQVDRAMRLNPTVLLILSKHSIHSDWVEHEVRTARALEKDMKRDVLCPVAIDDSWKNSPWAKRIMEQVMEYNILDFSEWKDTSKFGNTFNKLIDGLELFYK